MGTSNPAEILGIGASRAVVTVAQVAAIVDSAVAGALAGALAGKADLEAGVVPDTQLPSRLTQSQLETLALEVAEDAATTALNLRHLPLPTHETSVALGDTSTGEYQVQFGQRHAELKPVDTTPSAPLSGARLWVSLNPTTLKHQLSVRFPTGAPIILATEP